MQWGSFNIERHSSEVFWRRWREWKTGSRRRKGDRDVPETSIPVALTSLISLILDPPLPMREPHWLAGMTSRNVTGGLLVTVPFATRAVKSWSAEQGNTFRGEIIGGLVVRVLIL